MEPGPDAGKVMAQNGVNAALGMAMPGEGPALSPVPMRAQPYNWTPEVTRQMRDMLPQAVQLGVADRHAGMAQTRAGAALGVADRNQVGRVEATHVAAKARTRAAELALKGSQERTRQMGIISNMEVEAKRYATDKTYSARITEATLNYLASMARERGRDADRQARGEVQSRDFLNARVKTTTDAVKSLQAYKTRLVTARNELLAWGADKHNPLVQQEQAKLTADIARVDEELREQQANLRSIHNELLRSSGITPQGEDEDAP
jgi:hypothetical protein